MRASIVAAAALVVLAVGGWLGWGAYQSGEETEAAVRSIQTSARLLERQIEARKEDGVTFAEYLERSASTLKEVDKEAVALSSMVWKHKSNDRDQALEFIGECKAMIRLDASEVRLMLEESSAHHTYEDAKKALDQATTHESEWQRRRYQQAAAEIVGILGKKMALVEEARPRVERFLSADDAIKISFGKDKGISQEFSNSIRETFATKG